VGYFYVSQKTMGMEKKASIEFTRQLMRYAEVSKNGSDQSSLKRLGTCEFDFDLVRALSGATGLGQLRAISDSLQDVFSNSSADILEIVLNPSVCDAFFTLAPADLSPEQVKDQILFESDLLKSDVGLDWGEVRYEPVRTQTLEGQKLNWYHVIRVSSHVIARLESLLIHLPIPDYSLTTSYRGVGALIENSLIHRQPEDSLAGIIVALGCFKEHIEFSVVNKDKWVFGHSKPSRTSHDSSYFLASVLKMLNLTPKEVGNIYVYGDEEAHINTSNYEQVFRYTPSMIDPFAAFNPAPTTSNSDFISEHYAACLGAALRTAA